MPTGFLANAGSLMAHNPKVDGLTLLSLKIIISESGIPLTMETGAKVLTESSS